jgi:adenylylsulfate kinase
MARPCAIPKGLYAAAAAGRLAGVPGVDSTYEAPLAPDIVATGGEDPSAIEAVLSILAR